MNNIVVTVVYVLRALHRQIIVVSKIKRIRESLAKAVYGNKMLGTVYYSGRRG